MSIFRRPQPGSIIASASDVNPTNEAEVQRLAAAGQPWQRPAIRLFHDLAEFHYPVSYIGNALARFQFPVGVIPADDLQADPVIPTRAQQDAIYRQAQEIMFRLEGDQGGPSQMARLYAMNVAVAGEGLLAGQDRSRDETNWEFLSVEELRAQGDGTFLRFSVNSQLRDEGYEPQFVERFWRPDPFRTYIADSPMSSLISDAERLQALNESMTARIVSRLSSAGLMFIPSSMTMHGAPEAPTGDGQVALDPFMVKFVNDFQKVMTSSDKTINRALPTIVRGNAAEGEAIRFLTMDRTIDRVEMELRAELRNNLATGVDLPPEVQQGMGNATHFQSWGIGDATYQSHLLPEGQRWADGLTRVYLWRQLRKWAKDTGTSLPEAELRRYVVTADGSDVVTRPNAAEDGRQVRDRLALSNEALRRSAGVPETDAPSDDEYVRQLGVKSGNEYLATWNLPVHDLIDWEKAAAVGKSVGAPGAGGTPPSRRPADTSDTPDEPADGEAAAQRAEVFAAAASGHLAAAQKTVGAKVRALAQATPDIAALVKNVANEKVLATLDDWEGLDLSTRDVVDFYRAALAPLADALGQPGADTFVARVAGLAAKQQHSPITMPQLRELALGVLSTPTS